MTEWDPAVYLHFGAPRLRPALDLLAHIPTRAPEVVVDAGCGPGNVTPYLVARWPEAEHIGVDRSPQMLAEARADHPDLTWVEADLATWRPSQSPDVVFSNAALHWLDDHRVLFPGLVAALAPGGALAVQMPHNHHAPTHTLISEVVEEGPWADILRPLERRFPVADPDWYHALLRPLVAHLDIWETTYLHELTGDDPVARWTRGSVLRPLLAALGPDHREVFFRTYADRVAQAYPPGDDGVTVLPFTRLFIVATVA